MHRVASLLLAVAVSVPLAADPAKSATAPAATDTTGTAARTDTALESPMVAAARRANRLGRKPAFVITNETVKTAGGRAHVTTTESQPEIEVTDDRATREREAILAKRAEEKRRKDRDIAVRKRTTGERGQRTLAGTAAPEDGYHGEQEDADPAAAAKPPLE